MRYLLFIALTFSVVVNGECPATFHPFVTSTITGRPVVKVFANNEHNTKTIDYIGGENVYWSISGHPRSLSTTIAEKAYENARDQVIRETRTPSSREIHYLRPGQRMTRLFFPKYQISYGVMQKRTAMYTQPFLGLGRPRFIGCEVTEESETFVRNPIVGKEGRAQGREVVVKF